MLVDNMKKSIGLFNFYESTKYYISAGSFEKLADLTFAPTYHQNGGLPSRHTK